MIQHSQQKNNKFQDPAKLAYLAQVLNDIKPYLICDGDLKINTRNIQTELEPDFEVIAIDILYSFDGITLEGNGLADNFYDSLRDAKESLVRQLCMIINSEDFPDPRDLSLYGIHDDDGSH